MTGTRDDSNADDRVGVTGGAGEAGDFGGTAGEPGDSPMVGSGDIKPLGGSDTGQGGTGQGGTWQGDTGQGDHVPGPWDDPPDDLTGPGGDLRADAGPLTFSYRPAVLRAAVTWRLADDCLTSADSRIDLRKVTAVAFVETRVQIHVIRYLALEADGETYRIQVNGTGTKQDAFQAHLALVDAVMARLAVLSPDCPVRLTDTGKSRMAMFVIGVIAVLFGVGLFFAGIFAGARNLIEGSIAAAALTLFGLYTALSNRPWREPVVISATLAREVVHAMRTPE